MLGTAWSRSLLDICSELQPFNFCIMPIADHPRTKIEDSPANAGMSRV